MIAYRESSFLEARPIVEAFLPAQWAHTGDSRIAPKVNWPFYQVLAQKGCLVILVAEDEGRAAGYLTALIHPHLNAIDTLVGTISTYYVEPRPDRAIVLKSMFGQAIEALKLRNVAVIKIDTEYENSCGRLLELLGFEPERIGYKLWITQEKPNA